MTPATRVTTRRSIGLETRISSKKIMSRACAALNDFDFSCDDSSSLEEDEKPKCKKGDFIGLYLMGKSSRHITDSNSDVSDDISFEGFFESCRT
jgi:hypothetical protein